MTIDEALATNEILMSSAKASLESMQRQENKIFTTMPDDTFDEKRQIVAHVTNAKKIDSGDPKSTMIGKPFRLVNFIVQLVTVNDVETKKPTEQTRVILVTDKGEAFYAISSGIMGSLDTILGTFGNPNSWPEALPVQVNTARSRQGFTFFELVVL